MRLVDALIKAGKDFELLVVPNANHGMGGAYGQRRMRDFFVRHLLGGEPRPPARHRAADCRTRRARRLARPTGRRPLQSQAASSALARPGRPEQRPQRASRRDRALLSRPGQPAAIAAAAGLAAARRADPRLHHAVARPARTARLRPARARTARSTTCCSGTTWPTSCGSSTSATRSAPSRRRWSRSPGRSSTSTRRGASSSRWTGRRSPATSTGLTKEIAEARRTLERRARGQRTKRSRKSGRQPGAGGRRGPAEHAPRPGSASTTAMTRSSPGGCRSRTRRPTRRSRPMPTSSASDIGAVGGRPGGDSGSGRPQAAAVAAAVPAAAAAAAAGRRGTGDRPEATRRSETREIVGNPIGREALLSELKYEMIAYTPEELIELARKELSLVRGRDEEGRARDGPGRRLAGGARARQDAARRARQAAGLDPRPGARGDRLPRRQQPRDDPAALPRLVADGHDVARAAAREPVLHRRRDDQRLVSRRTPCPTRRS